jgi:hypothetical protein
LTLILGELPVADNREIARCSLDLQARARDFRVFDLPGYFTWIGPILNTMKVSIRLQKQ